MSADARWDVDVDRKLTIADTDDWVQHAQAQTERRRKWIPSPREPPPEVAVGRVAQTVADVDVSIAPPTAGRNIHRQPEVHHGIDDDVIGRRITQRKYVRTTAIDVVYNVSATKIGLEINDEI